MFPKNGSKKAQLFHSSKRLTLTIIPVFNYSAFAGSYCVSVLLHILRDNRSRRFAPLTMRSVRGSPPSDAFTQRSLSSIITSPTDVRRGGGGPGGEHREPRQLSRTSTYSSVPTVRPMSAASGAPGAGGGPGVGLPRTGSGGGLFSRSPSEREQREPRGVSFAAWHAGPVSGYNGGGRNSPGAHSRAQSLGTAAEVYEPNADMDRQPRTGRDRAFSYGSRTNSLARDSRVRRGRSPGSGDESDQFSDDSMRSPRSPVEVLSPRGDLERQRARIAHKVRRGAIDDGRGLGVQPKSPDGPLPQSAEIPVNDRIDNQMYSGDEGDDRSIRSGDSLDDERSDVGEPVSVRNSRRSSFQEPFPQHAVHSHSMPPRGPPRGHQRVPRPGTDTRIFTARRRSHSRQKPHATSTVRSHMSAHDPRGTHAIRNLPQRAFFQKTPMDVKSMPGGVGRRVHGVGGGGTHSDSEGSSMSDGDHHSLPPPTPRRRHSHARPHFGGNGRPPLPPLGPPHPPHALPIGSGGIGSPSGAGSGGNHSRVGSRGTGGGGGSIVTRRESKLISMSKGNGARPMLRMGSGVGPSRAASVAATNGIDVGVDGDLALSSELANGQGALLFVRVVIFFRYLLCLFLVAPSTTSPPHPRGE